ncbi:MAG: CaiF/GrlA family transcriptional regulator [Hafnia sp.]
MAEFCENKKITLGNERKDVNQKNHEGCLIPSGLEWDESDPLYIIIAKWCTLRKTWVSRKQIAQAFRISERRASFQISYMTRKPHLIRCELRRVKNDGARNSSYEVWVHSVDNNTLSVQSLTPKARGTRRSKVGIVSEEMRDLLHQLWPVRGVR